MLDKKIKINKLKCEYLKNPIGIDVLMPRLSWQLNASKRGAYQRAYQVIAAPYEELLLQADPVLWDSGKVLSDQSIQIPYAGPGLQSRQRVHWRVRVWDQDDQLTDWSEPAWFEMGLLNQGDWEAQWIGNPLVGGPHTPVPSPYFRKEFAVDFSHKFSQVVYYLLGTIPGFHQWETSW